MVLNPRELMTFLTLVRLILEHNSNKNYRKLSIEKLLSELPFQTSARSLSNYLNKLLELGFITTFRDNETGHSVFSLKKVVTSYGYSKIDNHILTDLAREIGNPTNFKIYILIFAIVELFKNDKKNKKPKSLRDMINILGMSNTKSSKDIVSQAIKALKKDNFIGTTTSQKIYFLEKKFIFTLELSWRDLQTVQEIEPETKKVENEAIANASHKQDERHEKAEITTAISKNNDSYNEFKKETIIKSKIKSKDSEILPKTQNQVEINKVDKTLNFNFYKLDKLKNPLTITTIISISRSTGFSLEQLQLSIKRFSDYLNSDTYNSEYRDPIAFLSTHLRKYGEYVPPESYLQNSHKKDESISKEEYQDVVSMALNFVANENNESGLGLQLEKEVSQSRGEDLKLREMARRELEGIFPKTSFKTQSRMLKRLVEKYLDSAVNLVKQNIPVTMENLT